LNNNLLQFRDAHETVYKRAAFSGRQRAQLASLWHNWKSCRRALDTRMHAAFSALQALPSMEDLRIETLDYIAKVAEGTVPPPAFESSVFDHVPRYDLAQGAMTHYPIFECDYARSAECVGIVGIRPRSIEVSAEAVQHLNTLQEEDLRQQNDFLLALLLPSAAVPATCQWKFIASKVDHHIVVLDHLYLCKNAAEEVQHGKIFTPLPLDVWPCPRIQKCPQ
jgi:hypothetical protein